MAKAILEFDLSDPDDENLHKLCMAGTGMSIVLAHILNDLRQGIKHGVFANQRITPEQQQVLESVRTQLLEHLNDNAITHLVGD